MDEVMQKFFALPTSGDAFLLQRNDVNILVDSGWKKDNLAQLLTTHVPDLKFVHIAVCTHADGDHAGGFTTLLDNWHPVGEGRCAPIGQFWLPGAWAGVVPGLMLRAREFVDKLINEMEDLSGQICDVHLESAIDAALAGC